MDFGIGINNAAFLDNERIVCTTETNGEPFDESEGLKPDVLAVYDLKTQQLLSHAPLQEPAGTLMPVGEDFVLGLYEHPKLIDVKTGQVVMRWPEIESGKQNSSINRASSLPPPIALDARNKRFAVASKNAITVIVLG